MFCLPKTAWPPTCREPARGSQSQKTGLSTDKSLQLDSLKSESLVIPDQQAGVNTFPKSDRSHVVL